MNDEIILKKLDDLIKEGNALVLDLYSYNYYLVNNNIRYIQNITRWSGASYNLLKIRFGVDSEYLSDFNECLNRKYTQEVKFVKENIGEATGILEYVYDALKSGLTDDLFYKREVIVFSDLLDQAFEFLENGLKLAAGIYGRIVLETTIREYAAKHNISKPKFDQLIIELRKNNVISKPLENALRSNYEYGSWAVHGKQEFQELTDNQIKEYLTFIKDKVLTLE